jgi:CRISPR-associated endoribonuclease Cas6
MRVRIVFNNDNKGGIVPFYHQYLISNLIEEVVLELPVKFRTFRSYNFSGLKGQIKVSKEGLQYLSSKVTLVFSCPNQEFIDTFLSGLFKREKIKIGELNLRPDMVEREPEISYMEEMKYVCISPIIVTLPTNSEADTKRFISPFTDEFSDLLYEVTIARMESSGKYESSELSSFYKFQIVPDKEYLAKIKEGDKKFARIYPVYENGQKLELRGYTFPFTLYADKKVHEFIFECGMGALCNRGFGMVDLANHLEKQKTVPYNFAMII